jgi:hypothetical protein
MATVSEVLTHLRPMGGWVIVGDCWEGVSFIEAEPVTKTEFDAGFAQVDAAKAQAEAEAAAKKAAAEAKLAALGLTADDLKALGLGGN